METKLYKELKEKHTEILTCEIEVEEGWLDLIGRMLTKLHDTFPKMQVTEVSEVGGGLYVEYEKKGRYKAADIDDVIHLFRLESELTCYECGLLQGVEQIRVSEGTVFPLCETHRLERTQSIAHI